MARLSGSQTLTRLLCVSLVVVCAVGSALLLRGCDQQAGASTTAVTIAGKKFFVEVVADNEKRMKGLMHRDHIEEDGGMIFVFPYASQQAFWMGNCLVDMDILYLDGSGRVVATAEMKKEPPKRPEESEEAYDARMPRYPSKFPAQFAIELRAGKVKELGVKAGDLVEFDREGLKKRAK